MEVEGNRQRRLACTHLVRVQAKADSGESKRRGQQKATIYWLNDGMCRCHINTVACCTFPPSLTILSAHLATATLHLSCTISALELQKKKDFFVAFSIMLPFTPNSYYTCWSFLKCVLSFFHFFEWTERIVVIWLRRGVWKQANLGSCKSFQWSCHIITFKFELQLRSNLQSRVSERWPSIMWPEAPCHSAYHQTLPIENNFVQSLRVLKVRSECIT